MLTSNIRRNRSGGSKSHRDPAEWTPTKASTHCIYAREWIWVKYAYGLSVDAAEHAALDGLFDRC